MGVLDVNGQNDQIRVKNTSQMMGMFLSELSIEVSRLTQQLDEDPTQFENVENRVHELFNRGAGLFLSGILAEVMQTEKHKQRGDNVRNDYAIPLRSGQDRKIRISLGSGFSCDATTRYCQPATSSHDKSDSIPGIDVELSLFGFSAGNAPRLVSKVVRGAALCQSLEQARKELQRDGIHVSQEEQRGIVYQFGRELLTVRERLMEQFERGEMTAGNEFAGKTVSIQIDGGRTRTRSDIKPIDPVENFAKTQSEATGRDSLGRSKETKRKGTYDTEWKEPKLFKIYVHDDDGRVDQKFEERIDGSFGDANQIERLLAMRMYQLGVHRAESITFNSDGAKWIWDRIDSILTRAKVPSTVLIFKILDVYHAAENLNKGIKALGKCPAKAIPADANAPSTLPAPVTHQEVLSFSKLRSELRDGLWRQVVDQLESASKQSSKNVDYDSKEVSRVIEYLRKHGQAGHMDYPKYSMLGLPLGSGPIESVVRRVVNLRMKGNGLFWKLENAECMLAIRSSIVSDRWDEDHARVNMEMLKNRKLAFPKPKKKRSALSDAEQRSAQTQ